MKKLLIAMTAAAVGTCAWAEGEAGGEGTEPTTTTYFTETFAGWSNDAEAGYVTSVAAPWSYGTVAVDGEGNPTLNTADPQADELKVVNGALSLNTGSKVLRGAFGGSTVAIPNDGLYFKSTVTFKDPSDTLPTLGEADKFALVVLDNVESIDAGYTATPATNLWVIAKYGESGQRAYQLNVEVDPTWLAAEHKIVVKAYNNVMANGNCAGFLVKVDNEDNDTVCTVVQSCAIVNGVIDYGTSCAYSWWKDGDSGNLGYLGYAKDAIAASMQLRYENAELLLSNVPGSDTLASVDFQGQGVIDDVSLATTGADFGADALVFTVGVSDGVTLTSDATVYYGAAGETKNITFTLAAGYVLKAPLAAVKGDNGVYTYAYTTVADNNQVVNIEAYKPAAYIGDTAYETFAGALAAGGTIELANNVSIENETAFQIESGVEVTIDLKGKTITASASVAAFENYGTLTITDSVGGGKVDGAIIGGEGAVYNLIGGSFKNVYPFVLGEGEDALTFDFPGAGNGFTATLTDGYYVIAAASTSDYPESDKLVASDTELTDAQKEAVEATFDAIAGEAADADAAVTNYFTTVYGENVKVPVATITGAKNIDISVKFNLPLMTAETPTIEVAPATVTADSGNAAAFEFTIKDGGDNALTLSQAAKVLEMVQYVADLANEWAAATEADVDTSVNAGKAKVELKAKTGVNKGFIRLKLR